MQRSVKSSGFRFTALVAALALSGEARGDDVLGATDVQVWADDPCPLGASLGPLLDADGAIAVEVTKKKLTIRIGDGENAAERQFFVRTGPDLDAMRDTVLGNCTRSPSVTGVTSVRFDLRNAFDAPDPAGRQAAVVRAVDALRKQRQELRRAVPDLVTSCDVPLPTLPPAPSSTANRQALQGYLASINDATAVLTHAADGCRALERVQVMAPDLVASAPAKMRSVRERAALAVMQQAEARRAFAPRLGKLLVAEGYVAAKDVELDTPPVTPWTDWRAAIRSEVSKGILKCIASIDGCVIWPGADKFCPELRVGFVKGEQSIEARTSIKKGFYPYVGGTTWCATEEGRSVCAAVLADDIAAYGDATEAGCRDAFVLGDGPANVVLLKNKLENAQQEEFENLARIMTLFKGSGSGSSTTSTSSRSSEKTCETVYTCTCRDDGKQIVTRSGCPGYSYGCESGWNYETHKECQ